MALLSRLAEMCEAIRATTRKTEKVRLLAEYFRSLGTDDAARAAVFLSGRPFPVRDERQLSVGWSLLVKVIAGITGAGEQELFAAYRQHGDIGAMAQELWGHRASGGQALGDLAESFALLAAARGPSQKHPLLAVMLGRSSGLEAKYVIKIISSDLRIGLKESLVEEAIGVCFGAAAELVQRANLFTGDIGETLRLAAAGRLADARLRLFHPIGFMLATPLEAVEDAFAGGAIVVEDKYDGIRAHAHREGPLVRIFSRTLDDITHQFPELTPALLALPGSFLLDGEILAWRDGRALPFAAMQKRLGRKRPDAATLGEVPVAFMAFDLLYQDGDALFDTPLAERRRRLEAMIPAESAVLLSQLRRIAGVDALWREFDAAQARGNEGLMIKQEDSLYTAGRRGGAWRKLKKEMATLDVVVTAAEYGHGKRHQVLSDYTFAVRGDGGELLDIGKAYSGLTDQEIDQLTAFFLEHTIEDRGLWRRVAPVVVLEVAFNNIQRSSRHASGFALRFPRIKRIRHDKSAADIDTIATVTRLAERPA